MYLLSVYRQAVQRLALKKLGHRLANERIFAGQQISADHQFEVFKLPPNLGPSLLVDSTEGSPTFGQPFFLVGISAVEGPDIIGG